MKREPFIWNDMKHWTGAELIETVALIDSRKEGASFMEAYIAACESQKQAEENVLYILGNLGEDGKASLRFFDLKIPLTPVPGPQQWWKDSSLGVKTNA